MPSALARPALRLNKSMQDSAHHAIFPDTVTISPQAPGPLGYLYSEWDPELLDERTEVDPMAGGYDPRTQTWDNPDAITAGVLTKTCSGYVPGSPYCSDYVTDDNCT